MPLNAYPFFNCSLHFIEVTVPEKVFITLWSSVSREPRPKITTAKSSCIHSDEPSLFETTNIWVYLRLPLIAYWRLQLDGQTVEVEEYKRREIVTTDSAMIVWSWSVRTGKPLGLGRDKLYHQSRGREFKNIIPSSHYRECFILDSIRLCGYEILLHRNVGGVECLSFLIPSVNTLLNLIIRCCRTKNSVEQSHTPAQIF